MAENRPPLTCAVREYDRAFPIRPSVHTIIDDHRRQVCDHISSFQEPRMGFSINHAAGCKHDIMSLHRLTSWSDPSKSLSFFALDLAMLYCVHGGEHHTASNEPPSIRYSNDPISTTRVGRILGSESILMTSQPRLRNILPIDPVPLNSSSKRGI